MKMISKLTDKIIRLLRRVHLVRELRADSISYLTPKACDKCGHKAHILRSSYVWRYWVRCTNPECGHHSKRYKRAVDAVFAWNHPGEKKVYRPKFYVYGIDTGGEDDE